MKSAVSIAILISMLVTQLCLSASADETTPKPLGNLVGSVHKLSDGRELALHMYRETEVKAKKDVAFFDYDGEWRNETYQFTITSADGKSTEVVTEIRRSYAVKELSIIKHGLRFLDAYSENNIVTLLYVDTQAVIRCSFQKKDGLWSKIDIASVPYMEIASRDRIVVKGALISNYLVQLDYKNGDMEKWLFEPNTTASPKMIDHNDLKVIFKPASTPLSELCK